MKKVKLEAHTSDSTILIGYVDDEPATLNNSVEVILESFGDLYLSIIDDNLDLLTEANMTVQDLTSCPVLQNWEGILAVTGTHENGEHEEYII